MTLPNKKNMSAGIDNSKRNTYWAVATLFMVVKLCLHFFTNTRYELHRDEMLYFNMGEHPDFGYASTPPFMGVLAFVVQHIFGYSVFGIRFFPALAGALSVFLLAKTVEALKGGIWGLIIAAPAFIFSGGFLIFDTLFTPNAFEQCFWLLVTYLLLKMTITQNPACWIWIGLATGVAFLNKYSIVFLVGGFLPALWFSRHRALLKSGYFMIAIALGTLIAAPNIWWQYEHGWPVVHHMQELEKTQLVNVRYADFFADLFTLTALWTFVWLVGLVALLVSKTARQHRYLGIGTLLTMALFLFTHGKPYYLLGLIPFLFAFGGQALERYCTGKLAWIGYGVLVISIAYSVFALPFALPVLRFERLDEYSRGAGKYMVYPFARWEDGKKYAVSQVYADMTGWKELAGLVATAYARLSKTEQQQCTIYGERNYGYAGAVHFYGKAYGLPGCVTLLDSYTLWAPDSIPPGPLIYINTKRGGIADLFDVVTMIGQVGDKHFREQGLTVFVCRQPKTDIQALYHDKAAAEKNLYRRIPVTR